MLEAAVEGLGEGAGAREAGVLAVTVLTSLTAADLAAVGVNHSLGRQVARLARLADGVAAEGVVCSVKEVRDVAQVAPRLIIVTPGVRPAGADRHDQERVATPQQAIERGADLIVVGRAITRADDPVAAAITLTESIVESPPQAR